MSEIQPKPATPGSRRRELSERIVSWEVLNKSHKLHRAEILETVSREIDLRDRDRQAVEDTRAIRRNRNRFATLMVALALGFTIPTVLPMFGPMGLSLMKYSFAITILLDAGLAAYAYIKRY